MMPIMKDHKQSRAIALTETTYTETFKKIFSKSAESWLQMMRSNILEMTGNKLTGL